MGGADWGFSVWAHNNALCVKGIQQGLVPTVGNENAVAQVVEKAIENPSITKAAFEQQLRVEGVLEAQGTRAATPASERINSAWKAIEEARAGNAEKNAAVGAPKTLTPVERFDQLVAEGKVTGSPENLEHVRKRLASTTNKADRIGAEAELQEMERQIAKGAKPEVQGGQRGTDSPTSEVKARTEPFLSEKNAQNHFNTTIKKASEQFGGQGSTGEAVINLGKETSILGKPITEETARQIVAEALSKGGRGKNITNVLVVDGNGKVIYSGLGR